MIVATVLIFVLTAYECHSIPEVSDGDLEAELAGLQDAWAEEDAAGVFLPGKLHTRVNDRCGLFTPLREWLLLALAAW